MVAFGLGNPGKRYCLTRHNIGKEVVIGVMESLGLSPEPGKGEFIYAHDAARDLFLVVPTTYVNTCGTVAVEVLDLFGASPDRLLAVSDDFSLPLGSIRIRKRGSDGGHNGLASIIYHLASQEFPRVRLGVGPLPLETDPADFVLSRFAPEEQKMVERLKEDTAEALLGVTDSGLDRAMSKYNKRADA